MGTTQNLELIEELQQTARDQDFERYGQLIADDATVSAVAASDTEPVRATSRK